MAKKEINVEGLAPPVSHYVHAVEYDNILYISGCCPLDGNGKVVSPGDVTGQTEFVLDQMKTILENSNCTFANVAKVTVLVTNMDDIKKINEVRKKYFGDSYPASTLFEVSRLCVDGMLVEIEAVAHI